MTSRTRQNDLIVQLINTERLFIHYENISLIEIAFVVVNLPLVRSTPLVSLRIPFLEQVLQRLDAQLILEDSYRLSHSQQLLDRIGQ